MSGKPLQLHNTHDLAELEQCRTTRLTEKLAKWNGTPVSASADAAQPVASKRDGKMVNANPLSREYVMR